jgi:hypothetical protein
MHVDPAKIGSHELPHGPSQAGIQRLATSRDPGNASRQACSGLAACCATILPLRRPGCTIGCPQPLHDPNRHLIGLTLVGVSRWAYGELGLHADLRWAQSGQRG